MKNRHLKPTFIIMMILSIIGFPSNIYAAEIYGLYEDDTNMSAPPCNCRLKARGIKPEKLCSTKKRFSFSYRRRLDIFYNHINKSAANITTNDIRDFITYLGEVRGNKISTIQSYIKHPAELLYMDAQRG